MKKKIVVFFLILILSISLSSAIKTITVNETDLVSLKLKARDEDGDQLSYSFTEPLNGEGKWQTDYGDAGEYKVRVTASDGELSAAMDVLLIIKKKNIRPSIDSFFPEGKELRIDEGEGIDFNVKASDLNKDALSYIWKFDGRIVSEEESYSYKADYFDGGKHKIILVVSDGEKAEMKEWLVDVNNVDRGGLLDNIKGVTVDEGNIVKLELPDFKKYNLDYTISEPIGNDNNWKTDYGDDGVYNVTIMIKDGDFSLAKRVNVEVIDMDRAPVLKPIANAWMEENQKVVIELEANDPDNDEIEFYVGNMPNGASIKGNVFEWITDYDSVKKENVLDETLNKFHLLYKPFRIEFIAKSKESEARQYALIMIKDVNRAPLLDDIPMITVNEGEEVVITPNADDPDGDDVVYSYSGWIDLDRYMTNYEDAGTYKVKVIASDGFLTDEKFVTIEVKDVNRAPVFQDIGKLEIDEDERLELMLHASDPEGDSVDISSESLPRNSTIEDSIFRWTPDYDTVSADFGVFLINFKASDGKSEAIKPVNITVRNVNRKPKIIAASKRDITVKSGKKVKFEVRAEDPDGNELSYLWKFSLLEQYKSGSAIIRTFTSVGDKKVKVVVSDGKDDAVYVFNVKVV